MPKKNLYTSLKNMDTKPHKDTGDNNLYTALGWKKKKKANDKIKADVKKRVESVK